MSAEAHYAAIAAWSGLVCLACGLVLLFAFPPVPLIFLLAGNQIGMGSAVLAVLGGYYRREIRLTLVKTITRLRS